MILDTFWVYSEGLKLIKIPDETCKYISITVVNNYTISQSAEGNSVRKPNTTTIPYL